MVSDTFSSTLMCPDSTLTDCLEGNSTLSGPCWLIRKGLLDHIKVILEKANYLNAHHLTVHPLSPPSFRRADSLEDSFQTEHQDYFRGILKENLIALTESAGNVLIIVENCHLGKSANAALTELFMEETGISLALDWAKMHTAKLELDEDQHSFYMKHRKRIRELHLHDMDEKGRSHLVPGQGCLDFKPLFRQFYDENQWITIEVRPSSEAVKAKDIFMAMVGNIGGT